MQPSPVSSEAWVRIPPLPPSREVGGRRRHKEISRDDFPRFLTSVFNGMKTGINSALRREGNDTNSEIQGQFKGFGMESNCVWLFLSVTDVTKTYDGGRPKSASPSVIPNLGSHVNSLSSISTWIKWRPWAKKQSHKG